jgi:uncharacterized protein DUF72
VAIHGYYLGCPGWGVPTWVGRLFPTATRPSEFVERYARVFNAVEGNTTFYALPRRDVVERWRDQVSRAARRRAPVRRAPGGADRALDRRGQAAVLLHARARRHVRPGNAYAFHAMVRRHRDVGALPDGPGGPRQLSLL